MGEALKRSPQLWHVDFVAPVLRCAVWHHFHTKSKHDRLERALCRKPIDMVGIGKPALSFEKKPILKVAF